MKDGWHIIYGWKAYVENNEVKRIVENGCTCYPYVTYRKNPHVWTIDTSLSPDALRKRIDRGTAIIR